MTRKRKGESAAVVVTYRCLTCSNNIPTSLPASLRPRVWSTRIEWCPTCEALTNQRNEASE